MDNIIRSYATYLGNKYGPNHGHSLRQSNKCPAATHAELSRKGGMSCKQRRDSKLLGLFPKLFSLGNYEHPTGRVLRLPLDTVSYIFSGKQSSREFANDDFRFTVILISTID